MCVNSLCFIYFYMILNILAHIYIFLVLTESMFCVIIVLYLFKMPKFVRRELCILLKI